MFEFCVENINNMKLRYSTLINKQAPDDPFAAEHVCFTVLILIKPRALLAAGMFRINFLQAKSFFNCFRDFSAKVVILFPFQKLHKVQISFSGETHVECSQFQRSLI